MGKKKFINKKNSATFHILARDTAKADTSATGEHTSSDRVFVRVDRNTYSVPEIESNEEDELDDDSIFADAEDDVDVNDVSGKRREKKGGLSDELRKEIIELGFPDDGYNYLKHLREIKNSGGGSTYYHNDKAQIEQLPLDVKAYDASRIKINASISSEDKESRFVYNASNAVVVRKIQKAVDPDVARLLDDSDLSRFGSDVEDLELDDDFVIKANPPDGEDEAVGQQKFAQCLDVDDIFADVDEDDESEAAAKPRVSRPLDEQFDLLYQEYESNDGCTNDMYCEDEEYLAAKMSDALQIFGTETECKKIQYKVPKEDMEQGSDVVLDASSDVIQKCKEYAKMYCNESENDKEVVLVEESSDDSEIWDCETIVSTYSNFDNHPGKIQAPVNPKKRLPKIFPGEITLTGANVIALGGKQKLPVDSLPNTRKAVEKVKVEKGSLSTEKQNRKLESKEEKKERKAAVKEEKREARRAKKELKELYKTEAQKAQKVAAISGPSSVHLA